MIKCINTYDDPVLLVKAVPCVPFLQTLTSSISEEHSNSIWTQDIIDLVQDLKDTAESLENCAGLASNHIWDLKDGPPPAVFVLKFTWAGTVNNPITQWFEFINPIVKTTGKTIKLSEGCFSLPGYTNARVKREANVIITYQTLASLETNTLKLMSKDNFGAIAAQHEYDHLKGKLIV